MRYLFLIYSNEVQNQAMSKAEQDQAFGQYMAFNKELGPAIQGGEALEPIATATTVRVRNSKTQTTDGPFAETKEQLGGFYMVEAKNLDEAIKWAAKIPHAASGSVEIRPIREITRT